jgi:serine/threonine protein kinase
MKGFFGSLFGRVQERRPETKPGPPVRREAARQGATELYKKGDVISWNYEVHGTLGKGGFGVVILVYDREMGALCALKTFRDEFLNDAGAREAFKKEALLWVGLEQHPFILAAQWVVEVDGRVFVAMEYVAPNADGRVNLGDYLSPAAGPIDVDQALKWAVQFCLGMEHALGHGIKCHRDIKPANILIAQDGGLKIGDFGLADGAEAVWRLAGCRGGALAVGGVDGSFGLSLMQTRGKARCGTPGYMPPEVYRGDGADVRSDIYSFGLVLWQMAAGSASPPYTVPYRGDLEVYLRKIYEQQMGGRLPRVDGLLWPFIERCLCPKPEGRYASFRELRGALEPILERRTGKKVEVPQVAERTSAFWVRRGGSLGALGRQEEAIGCCERALAINPRSTSAWCIKGCALASLGRREEAIGCYDEVLAVEPGQMASWYNKGNALAALGRREEAISCFDKALAITPRFAHVWNNKGAALAALDRREEALRCYEQALALDPRDGKARSNMGALRKALGRGDAD